MATNGTKNSSSETTYYDLKLYDYLFEYLKNQMPANINNEPLTDAEKEQMEKVQRQMKLVRSLKTSEINAYLDGLQ